MKNFFKNFFGVFFTCVFVLIFCSGCAKTGYSLLLHPDGSVEQSFQVLLDKKVIEDAGYNYDNAKNKIVGVFNNFINSQNQKILLYSNYKNISPEISGIKCEFKEIEETNLYAYLTFSSMNIFQDYKNYIKTITGDETEPNETTSPQIEDHVFYQKVINTSTTVYYKIYEDDFVIDLLNYFNGVTNGNKIFDLTNVEYNFFYGLPTDKIYSENSDVFYKNGMKIHHWKFDKESLDDSIITYSINIKPVMWYVVALGATFLLLGILAIIVVIRKKRKKVENNVENEQK